MKRGNPTGANQHGGNVSNTDNSSSSERNSKPGTLRRLARSHPDLLARVESGELSAHAAVDAGRNAAATMAKAPELMTATEAGKKGGRGKRGKESIPLSKGPTVDRLAARLKRDHPAIAARVANGEFKSIRAAALEAGIVKAVRHGDTRTIDLFAEPEARPVAAPPPPRPAVSTPAATGPATSLKQLPVKVITRKDGHTQTYHVAPEDESGSFGPVFRQFRHGGDGAGADVEEACGFFSGGFKMQICILVTTPSTAMR